MFLELNDLFILLQKMDESSFFLNLGETFLFHIPLHIWDHNSRNLFDKDLSYRSKKSFA